MESFSAMGTWWIPDAEDRKVAGTVSFNRDGTILLSISEALEEASPSGVTKSTRYPVILGDTRDGKELTLLGAFVTSRASHSIT